MTPTDALTQTHDLLSRVGWCQGASARDAHGRSVPCDNERAIQFSLDGALQRVTWPDLAPDPEEPRLWETLTECMYRLAVAAGMNGDSSPWGYLIDWNDVNGRTREQVCELVERCRNES